VCSSDLEGCELIVCRGNIKRCSVGITKPCNSTSFLNFEFFVDDVVESKVISTLLKLEGAKHVKLSPSIELQLEVSVATPANDIARLVVEDNFEQSIGRDIQIEVERDSTQIEFRDHVVLKTRLKG